MVLVLTVLASAFVATFAIAARAMVQIVKIRQGAEPTLPKEVRRAL